MTSLRELSPSERSKLRHFIRKYLRKLSAEQIAEKIKEEFGYEFKPSQIYRLAKPEKKTVKIDRDIADMLEEEFGSVSKGIKEVIKFARKALHKPPPHLRRAISQLGGRTLDYEEAVRELKAWGYENPDKILSELGKLGYLRNEQGKLKFLRYRVPTELDLLQFFAGMVK